MLDDIPLKLGRSDRITYTHYWASGPDRADPRAWTRLCGDIQLLMKHHPSMVVPNSCDITQYGSNKSIEFQIPHEPEFGIFILTGRPQSFTFCRTNGRKSDLLVTGVLLAAKKHLGSWLCLTSDGLWDDWLPAKELCISLLQYKESDFISAKKDFDSLETREVSIPSVQVPHNKVFSSDDITSEEPKLKE